MSCVHVSSKYVNIGHFYHDKPNSPRQTRHFKRFSENISQIVVKFAGKFSEVHGNYTSPIPALHQCQLTKCFVS